MRGTQYLAEQYSKFGTYEKALAAYNWGPGNLSKFGYERIPVETMSYIKKIMSMSQKLSGGVALKGFDSSSLDGLMEGIDFDNLSIEIANTQSLIQRTFLDFLTLQRIAEEAINIQSQVANSQFRASIEQLQKSYSSNMENAYNKLDWTKLQFGDFVALPGYKRADKRHLTTSVIQELNNYLLWLDSTIASATPDTPQVLTDMLKNFGPQGKGMAVAWEDRIKQNGGILNDADFMQLSIDTQSMADSVKKYILDPAIKRAYTIQQEIIKALDAAVVNGFEEGWDIGEEYGFTSEGTDKLMDSMRKRVVSMVKNKVGEFLIPQIQGMMRRLFTTMQSQASKAALDSAKEALEKAQAEGNKEAIDKATQEVAAAQQNYMKTNWFGDLFGGLFAGIFSSLLGFAIGALFTDFTEEARNIAQQQLESQKDRLTADGFSWSYTSPDSNVATPTYEFSSPSTQESIKVVRIATTINISSDAAMAMASHRREIERVVSELVSQYERNVAKTVGAAL